MPSTAWSWGDLNDTASFVYVILCFGYPFIIAKISSFLMNALSLSIMRPSDTNMDMENVSLTNFKSLHTTT